MYPSLFHQYVMKDILHNIESSDKQLLKKENELLKKEVIDLQNRLKWVIIAKEEIYNKYIKNIIYNSKKK